MSAAREAIMEALALANRLPLDTVWSVMVTHDTETDNPAAFNIYVSDDVARGRMRQALCLGTPDYESDDAEQHDNYSPRITLGIIEHKEKQS